MTTGKIKRSLIKSFLNTGTLLSPTWSLIGSGVASAKIAYNPKTESVTYISDDNASVTVESYAPQLPVEMIANNGDAVFEYIDNLRKTRATLGDAETELVNVWLYETPALGYYIAEKQSVAISTEDMGGDGGASAKINYTISFLGDPISGEFNPTPAAAFVARPINTILTTMVIGAVTLAPLFATDKGRLHYAGSVSNATTSVTMTSTLVGATIVQKVGSTPVAQGDPASLSVGVNHLTIEVTVGTEVSTYRIDITRAAS
jgi:hypothetical protein